MRPRIAGKLASFSTVVFALLSPTMATAADSNQHKYIVYVGTYGKGIHAFRFDSETGKAESLGLAGTVENPSWVTADRDFRFLYAVSELDGNKEGGVASFAIDRHSGKLRSLNAVQSGGVAPCHASVDATGKTLVVANYTTGQVSAFPIESSGSLGTASSLEKAHGSSVNKERQDGPHAHAAVITDNNERVYVPDLGLDEIRIYKLDAAHGKLTPNDPPVVKGEPGLGPRHIVFDASGAHAYVINELKPQVSVYEHDRATGNLRLIQTVRTLPADFTKENTGAEIRLAPSGKFLYASNRGHDSLQVYAVESGKGTLKQVQIVSTDGQEPRGFALDPSGHFLLAGNQKSDNIIVFRVDGETGKLTPSGQKLAVKSPVDVLFVPAA